MNSNSAIIENKYLKSVKEYSKISLVEKIEELGYIPTLDRNNDSNTA